MKKIIPLMLMLATATAATANEDSARPQPKDAVAKDAQAWTMFGRDLQNTNHYPFETGSAYKQVWSVRVGCPAPGMSSTTVDGQAMYNTSPCSNTGDVHAVGLDGKKLWSHGVGQGKRGIISTPCIHEGTLYCVDNGFIKAFDAKDGTRKWQQEITSGRVSISSPIAYEGKLHLIGTKGVQVLALDRSKSDEDKLIPIEGGHGATTPAFHKGTMIMLSERHVHSFDAGSLEANWKVELGMGLKERLIHSPVIDAERGRIFVVSSMPYEPVGQLRCLNFADGKELWQQKINGVGITPSVTFDGKHVYVAAMDGSISAFDAADGKRQWVWNLPGEPNGADGKRDYRRQLRGLISSKNKLVFCTSNRLFIISNDKPEGIDTEIGIGGYGSPTPAFYEGDLYFRYRTKENGAHNYRFTEVKQAAAELDVKIINNKARIRNLTQSKMSFFQLCYGINVNEKQNCVLCEFELQPGGETDLDLGRFMSIDEKVHHLLLSLEYEKPDGNGQFHHYYSINSGVAGE